MTGQVWTQKKVTWQGRVQDWSGHQKRKREKRRALTRSDPLEWDCPGHAKKGASEVESATG